MSDAQAKAVVVLLETTIHHIVERTELASPERTALLDQLREAKEQFGIPPLGASSE